MFSGHVTKSFRILGGVLHWGLNSPKGFKLLLEAPRDKNRTRNAVKRLFTEDLTTATSATATLTATTTAEITDISAPVTESAPAATAAEIAAEQSTPQKAPKKSVCSDCEVSPMLGESYSDGETDMLLCLPSPPTSPEFGAAFQSATAASPMHSTPVKNMALQEYVFLSPPFTYAKHGCWL